MTNTEPGKNYVYQPYPSGGDKIFSIAGPDVPFEYPPKPMTLQEAEKEAKRLNRIFKRIEKGE